jgi:hypothetical protein
MKLKRNNMVAEIEDRIPGIGQYGFFNNKIWRVSELIGNEIIHLERPIHNESISLFGNEVLSVKKVARLTRIYL